MTTGSKKIGVMSALLEARKALGAVAKKSYNDFHKFSYVSADTMVAACREVLHEHGLLVTRETQIDLERGDLSSAFLLSHPESGESIATAFPWAFGAEKGKPIDKALAGALTSSLNYYLRDILLIPRQEENEMDRRDDRGYTPPVNTQLDGNPRERLAKLASAKGPKWVERVLARCSSELGRECNNMNDISDDHVGRILKAHEGK